jgi:hypothetical protein
MRGSIDPSSNIRILIIRYAREGLVDTSSTLFLSKGVGGTIS